MDHMCIGEQVHLNVESQGGGVGLRETLVVNSLIKVILKTLSDLSGGNYIIYGV